MRPIEPPSSKLAAMIFYQLLLSLFWIFHSKCRVFRINFQELESSIRKKTSPTSRGSGESTQRHTQWITSAGFFDSTSSPGYYIVDLSRSWDSWYARRTSNQIPQGSSTGDSGVFWGEVSSHETNPDFVSQSLQQLLRKTSPEHRQSQKEIASSSIIFQPIQILHGFWLLVSGRVIFVCNSTVPLYVKQKFTLTTLDWSWSSWN